MSIQPNPTILRSLERGSAPEGVPVINVIDAIMGQGKTTFLIDLIRRKRWETMSPKFLVVVPLLSEVDRFTAELPELNFRNPQPSYAEKSVTV